MRTFTFDGVKDSYLMSGAWTAAISRALSTGSPCDKFPLKSSLYTRVKKVGLRSWMARAASFSSAITSCRCNSGSGCSWRQVSTQNCLLLSKDSCETMAGANARPMVTSAANLFMSASLHSDQKGVAERCSLSIERGSCSQRLALRRCVPTKKSWESGPRGSAKITAASSKHPSVELISSEESQHDCSSHWKSPRFRGKRVFPAYVLRARLLLWGVLRSCQDNSAGRAGRDGERGFPRFSNAACRQRLCVRAQNRQRLVRHNLRSLEGQYHPLQWRLSRGQVRSAADICVHDACPAVALN